MKVKLVDMFNVLCQLSEKKSFNSLLNNNKRKIFLSAITVITMIPHASLSCVQAKFWMTLLYF